MRLSISVAILLLLPAGTALAAKWVNISDGSARAVYLDNESLQRNGADVRAWTRETFTEEQRSPHTGAMYYSVSSLVRFDCNKRSTVPLTRVLYGSDGTEVRRFSLESVELPVVVTPGSLQEHLLQRACKPNADKKPAAAKVALAETQAKTDVPPGALATEAKGTETGKESTAAAPKPADAKPPEQKPAEQKPAEKIKTAAPASKPAVLEAPKSMAPQPHAARVIERRIIVSDPSVLRLQPPKARTAVRTVRAAPKREKPEHAEEAAHWSYEGKGAPQHWGSLKPEYAACGNGKRQSPIDIQDGAKLELQPIKFEYAPAALRIIDNGHTVQVNYAEGNAITVGGVRYELKQFHFHRPSEELVNGKAYDMVAHLVHKSADGRLAVVAVLFEMGMPNAFIASLWPYLPLEAGHEISMPEVTVDLNTLLPEMRSYYAYMGSLTTPPCTEGVLWLVLKTPVSVARDQVSIFGKLYSMNARPVQPGNGRLIKESM